MQTARPPDGFHIVELPSVRAMVRTESGRWPRLSQHWDAIKLRLSFTGHREGVLLSRGKRGWRLFVDDGLPGSGLPRVKVIYLPLGDTITIYIVVIG
jgi:hypothetical protein